MKILREWLTKFEGPGGYNWFMFQFEDGDVIAVPAWPENQDLPPVNLGDRPLDYFDRWKKKARTSQAQEDES